MIECNMNGLREGLENRMEISLVAGRSGKDTYVIYGKLGDGERLAVSETVSIELMDGSSVVREVLELRALVDGKYANVRACTGPCPFGVEVSNLEGYDVKTPDAVEARRRIKRFDQMVCLTPFRELKHGDESIYDWVEDGYAVPKKVLAYLMTTEPFFMSPGIYEHPFKPGKRLLGPYCYTDGHFWWDRDCWKYTAKYHVRLPREFVDYVMSGKGDKFMKSHSPNPSSWFNRIEELYGDTPHGNFLPRNAGNVDLKDF